MRIRIAILGIAALALGCGPALAEKRVALVIGNSAYQNVTALPNPVNDAAAITATLKGAGFDVIDSRRDLKANEMRRALRDFSDTARDADVAVVYYAGHGIEIDGTNYLIPVDASLERDIDAFDEAIPLDRILTVMEPAKQLRLAILDACRDNPFNKTMKRTIGTRAVTRGLAKVEPTSPNTLIAFAAKAGSTASDGDKNSPFTAALVKYLPKPGLDLRKAFGFVRDDVLKVTNNRQEPFVYGSLGGNDVTLVPAIAVTPPPATAAPDQNAAARRDYELAERVGTKAVWDYFITTYPTGLYTELAKAQRDKLSAEAARLAATEKAKAAQDEQTRLAIEGAKKAAQDKAAAEALKAEQARVAAELAKKAEEAKVAEAERAKAAAQAKAADEAKAKEEAKAKAEKPVGAVAALTPPDQTAQPPKPDTVAVAEIPKLLLGELRRVGCNTGAVGDTWNPAAQKAMELFNKNAGMKLDVKVASLDSLDAVKSKQSRVCPLICERGYKAEGDRCNKIVCKAGYQVGDDNSCEKIEVKKPAPPVAKRDEAPKREERAPKEAAKPATGGMQTICSFEIQGCRQVNKGCRANSAGTGEICN
ncbi:MAG: caspase family protein [Afipia sp.]|nr:caspase family protein [Afipia sp.]